MPIKNPKELLIAATSLPLAIEAKLPSGAPKISQTITDMADKLPVAPDFPMELPDLPAIPALPEGPAMGAGLKRYVTRVEVTPVTARVPVARAASVGRSEIISSPAVGVIPEIVSRRGI